MTQKLAVASDQWKEISFIVIPVEPPVQLHLPKEETFPIPLHNNDVTRTNLDVLQESRVDDCWNVDANRSLSDSWTGFTKSTFMNEKPHKGMYVVREETDNNSSNYQT